VPIYSADPKVVDEDDQVLLKFQITSHDEGPWRIAKGSIGDHHIEVEARTFHRTVLDASEAFENFDLMKDGEGSCDPTP